jgi:MFS family permease
MSVAALRPATALVAPALPAWRWVHVVLAALAMVATLPGRTQGLGLITEPLLSDLQLDRVRYGELNLCATLLSAAFCLPCGWLIDRLGTRAVLSGVLVVLGSVVIAMSQVPGGDSAPLLLGEVMFELFVLILLTRGLGQSALSVVSLSLIGQAAGRRSGPAVGIYSFVTALGFMASFAAIGYAMKMGTDWRTVWAGVGYALLVYALLCLILVRPTVSGWMPKSAAESVVAPSATLRQALRSPTFWIFALATSHYGLITAGVSLFNESILQERGFDVDVFRTIMSVTPLIGLASNLATGYVATRWPLHRLLAVAMAVLTVALLWFPHVQTLTEVYLYAAIMGSAGGMVTVLFFAVWGQAFGPAHLGKIQGAAQMLTVFASAGGPLLLALSKQTYGSYLPLFKAAAIASGILGVAAWFTRSPSFTSPKPEHAS